MIRILDPKLNEIARAEQAFAPAYVRPVLHVYVPKDVYSGFVEFLVGVYWIRVELDGKLPPAYPFPLLEEKLPSAPPQRPSPPPQPPRA